jgi:16S rRNA (adenine1518-N6/adenine1519-N6)-dimethyltransferase
VFWPVPNVDSGLVAFTRRPAPLVSGFSAPSCGPGAGNDTTAGRAAVFAVIDAAFAQRRKTLRAALAGWAGGPDRSERVLVAAGIDPRARGEALSVGEFAAIAAAAESSAYGGKLSPSAAQPEEVDR